jgi:hypothetical protein
MLLVICIRDQKATPILILECYVSELIEMGLEGGVQQTYK